MTGYGKYEYEVTATVRVYADDPDVAYARAMALMRCKPEVVNVRLIDEDAEP